MTINVKKSFAIVEFIRSPEFVLWVCAQNGNTDTVIDLDRLASEVLPAYLQLTDEEIDELAIHDYEIGGAHL